MVGSISFEDGQVQYNAGENVRGNYFFPVKIAADGGITADNAAIHHSATGELRKLSEQGRGDFFDKPNSYGVHHEMMVIVDKDGNRFEGVHNDEMEAKLKENGFQYDESMGPFVNPGSGVTFVHEKDRTALNAERMMAEASKTAGVLKNNGADKIDTSPDQSGMPQKEGDIGGGVGDRSIA
jgi:hypothetical protein